MESVTTIALKLLIVLALVLLNGFFVAAEFAIVKVRATQLTPLVQRGNKRARMSQHIIHHLDAYLSATQLGITMTSLGLGWIGEPFVARLLEPLFHRMNIVSDVVIQSVSFTTAFCFITFLHIVFGELAPKSVAIQKTRATTLLVSVPLHWFYRIFRPAIWLLNGAANLSLRLVGLHAATETDLVHSEEELRLLLAHSQEKEVSALARRLALRAFDLRKRIVRQIMLPRRRVVFLDVKRPLEENLKVGRDSKHTRFPLCDGGLDQVLGMIHVKDLVTTPTQPDTDNYLATIKRDMLIVPETTGLERMLSTFQRSHTHMALVVDEYGSTVGMVTIEDVLEELVGEIQDEFDHESPLLQDLGNGEFIVDGLAPLSAVNSALNSQFHSEDVDTLSGFLVEQLGRLPAENEIFDVDGFTFAVKRMGRRRIHQLSVKRSSAAQ